MDARPSDCIAMATQSRAGKSRPRPLNHRRRHLLGSPGSGCLSAEKFSTFASGRVGEQQRMMIHRFGNPFMRSQHKPMRLNSYASTQAGPRAILQVFKYQTCPAVPSRVAQGILAADEARRPGSSPGLSGAMISARM
jgi:hypothetical protein